MTKFAKTNKIDERWSEYDKSVARCQLENYGCIYLDEYDCPIDDEFVAEETFMQDSHKKCCICGKEFTGYGNNPDPVKLYGRCCDECDWSFVIPARIKQINEMRSFISKSIEDEVERRRKEE